MQNKSKPFWWLLAALTASIALSPRATHAQNINSGPVKVGRALAPVDYVNPYIGNISHLLVPTYPTVHLPNSMMRVYPQRGDFTSEYLFGLPLIVTGHRGGSVFNLRPFDGDANAPQPLDHYNYDLEKITPYRYSTYLDDCQTDVAFAPAPKAAIYTFNYAAARTHYMLLSARDGQLTAQGNVISGYQNLGGPGAKVYIYLVFSAQPAHAGTWDNNAAHFDTPTATGREASVLLAFSPTTPRLAARYGVSYISVEQARKNLGEEITDFDLSKVAAAGRSAWNQALGKITVTGDSENDKTIFYTALYRGYERMVNISEDGQYFSGFDGKVHPDNGVPFSTDDWSWDTHRALHPLHILINPQQEAARVASYIRMAEEDPNGWVPTFPGINGDGHAMNGKHFAAIIWDAYSKGLPGIDLATAYAHCKKTFMEETLTPWARIPAGGLDEFYNAKGYFPALKPGEAETSPLVTGERRQAVAVTLAASYDDWCLAQMAKALGKTDDYNYFLKRSYNYRNLFNKDTGFFHPKDTDGNFIEPFDYKFSGGMGTRDYYDENNGWTYRWDVPHNIGDLVQLMGGPQKLIENLDQLYNEPLGKSKFEFYAQLPDSTAMVGQFSMGNEPSMNIPYLYNYAGAPWKTQKHIRSLLEMWFRNDLIGVPGDEDGGGLSAFVVFSAMGFYPVTPGSLSYNIGSPLFSRITVNLGGGKKFVIDAKNCSHDNKYIQSARLNGQPWNKPWFSHRDIINGGKLELVMGSLPNKSWGAAPDAAPPSAGPELP